MKIFTTQRTKLPKWYLAYARAMANQYPDLTVADRIQELYKRLSWVATAIDVIAVIGSGAGKSVKRMKGEEEEDIVNHDFELRLLDPNPIQSGRTFLFSLLADYKLHNKAFIWLNVVNNKPIELWRIPPTMIGPKSHETLGIEYFLYDPGYGGQKIPIPVNEIVYWSGYDPYKLIDPDSSLTSIATVSANDLTMQKWSQHVYDGNGRLPGVLHFADMINDDQWEQIGEDIDTAAKNQNILRLRGTGTGAIGYIQTSSPPKDMEFYIGRDNNRDEIWNRIAPGLVSMLSENATEANSRSGKATIIDLVVYPLLQMLYECLTQQIIWRYYSPEEKIEPDDIRVTDRVLELAETAEFSKVALVNEVRTKYWNLDKLTDERGDMLVAEAQEYKTVKPPEPEVIQGEVVNGNGKQPQLPSETSNAQTDIEAQKEQASAKADARRVETKDPRPTILELEKWERKALKNIGQEFEFECYNTPNALVKSIQAELVGCANDAAVKAVFAQARDGLLAESVTPAPLYEVGDVRLLAEALNNYAAALKAAPAAVKAASDSLPSFNFTMAPITLTAQMPEQGQPSITFSPVIQPSDVTLQVNPTPVTVENEINNEINVQPSDVIVQEAPEKEKKVDVDLIRDRNGKLTGARGAIST